MKQLYDDLWQTAVWHPFSGVNTHAYFLRCAEGNVLFYNTGHADDIRHMAELGGIKYQYLSHRDEVGESLQTIKARFASALCCGSKEQAAVAEFCEVDVFFAERQRHFAGIEVIPTPGHTVGSLSFLYQSPHGLTYLFTGDTLFQSNDRWATLILSKAGGNASDLITSLKLYRALEPDVVLSSASTSGSRALVEVEPTAWRAALDDTIRDLQQQ